MPYVDYMLKLIKNVEKTRLQRLQDVKNENHYARIPVYEVSEFLKKYHPDYREGTKRKVRIGPNTGELLANRLVDILESRCFMDPDFIDLTHVDYETDVLVIGGGGAGAAAALNASYRDADVIMATKLRLGDANTMMAEGGIQAADKPIDSPPRHYLDALGGGHFSNDPELLMTLTSDAPLALRWLEDIGVMFDKEDDGTMKVLHGGGTSRKRMHSAGDMTGAAIMRVLRDEIRNRPDAIRVIEFSAVVELIMDDRGQCAGGIMYNMETGAFQTVRAKSTVIATGGLGRLHLQGFPTTNHYGATADGIVIAYHAGAPFCFMEYTQFHPTGTVFPEQNVGLLITEKVRGAGAQILNREGEQFVFPLEPRDVESSAIIRECEERKKGVETPTGRLGVWLDSPMLELLHGEGYVKKNFPAKYRQFRRHDIDISRQPILVFPTIHYQNGGLAINRNTETAIPGLFAAGEVTGGVHGNNRLMGNSLLDIVVFGRRAGMKAAARVPEVNLGSLTMEHVVAYNQEVDRLEVDPELTAPILLPDYRGQIG